MLQPLNQVFVPVFKQSIYSRELLRAIEFPFSNRIISGGNFSSSILSEATYLRQR